MYRNAYVQKIALTGTLNARRWVVLADEWDDEDLGCWPDVEVARFATYVEAQAYADELNTVTM